MDEYHPDWVTSIQRSNVTGAAALLAVEDKTGVRQSGWRRPRHTEEGREPPAALAAWQAGTMLGKAPKIVPALPVVWHH
jgi:hypothetical protein